MAIQMAAADLFDDQLDKAVIDEDTGARLHIPGEVLVGDRNFLNVRRRRRLMTKLSAGSRENRLQPHGLAFTQDDSGVVDLADTDPWTLKILDDRHGSPTSLRRLANGLDGSGMGGMTAVREIQPGGIHALFDQPV